MSNPIPEKVVNYNVYDDTEVLVGLTGDVTLPNLEAMSETVSGAGILGEYESSTPGHFGSTTIEFAFRTLFKKSFSFMRYQGRSLVLRAAQQSFDVSQGVVNHRGLKITLKYIPKGLDMGKLAVGAATESKTTLEIVYIKVEENDVTLLELDKLNFIYKIDGQDMLSNIKKLI